MIILDDIPIGTPLWCSKGTYNIYGGPQYQSFYWAGTSYEYRCRINKELDNEKSALYDFLSLLGIRVDISKQYPIPWCTTELTPDPVEIDPAIENLFNPKNNQFAMVHLRSLRDLEVPL